MAAKQWLSGDARSPSWNRLACTPLTGEIENHNRATPTMSLIRNGWSTKYLANPKIPDPQSTSRNTSVLTGNTAPIHVALIV